MADSIKYIISDTHFGHSKIIKYESRPFKTVEEMTETIVNNINEIVQVHDKLFWLGDVSFYGKKKTKEIMDSVNCGNNYLIMGNHDTGHSMKWWREVGFAKVYDHPIIYKDFFILSHDHVFLNDTMPYANFHGHLHSKKLVGDNYINCCVDVTGFKPLCLRDEIHRITRLSDEAYE